MPIFLSMIEHLLKDQVKKNTCLEVISASESEKLCLGKKCLGKLFMIVKINVKEEGLNSLGTSSFFFFFLSLITTIRFIRVVF